MTTKPVTCEICRGAIPNGEQMGGHTALCAGVVSLRLGDAIHEVERLRKALEDVRDKGVSASLARRIVVEALSTSLGPWEL